MTAYGHTFAGSADIRGDLCYSVWTALDEAKKSSLKNPGQVYRVVSVEARDFGESPIIATNFLVWRGIAFEEADV